MLNHFYKTKTIQFKIQNTSFIQNHLRFIRSEESCVLSRRDKAIFAKRLFERLHWSLLSHHFTFL